VLAVAQEAQKGMEQISLTQVLVPVRAFSLVLKPAVHTEQLLLGAQVMHLLSEHWMLQAVPKRLGLNPAAQTLQLVEEMQEMQLASIAVQLIPQRLVLLL
jgi:hypothetical protein